MAINDFIMCGHPGCNRKYRTQFKRDRHRREAHNSISLDGHPPPGAKRKRDLGTDNAPEKRQKNIMEKIYSARKTVFGALDDLKALGMETAQTGTRAMLRRKSTEVDALFNALTAKAKEVENAALLYRQRKARAKRAASATTTTTSSTTQVSSESSDCVVCLDKPRTILLTTCRHMCLCADCVKQIENRCPICRAAFDATHVVSVLMP